MAGYSANGEPAILLAPDVEKAVVHKNRNRLLASLRPSDASLLGRYLREVPIEQGDILEERGQRVDAVHFPQTGMVSFIVEMPEDRSLAFEPRQRKASTFEIRYTEVQLGQIQQTAACNALHDVASRMSRWLLQTSDKIEDDTIPFTREFLGKMLGVHRGTISLVATQFEAAGLIHTHRGKIELLDKMGLKNEACACYEFIRRHID